jgi:hypothetical protein
VGVGEDHAGAIDNKSRSLPDDPLFARNAKGLPEKVAKERIV